MMKEQGLYPFFNPHSIALVGVPRGLKAGTVFLLGLKDQGFEGPIYIVHPEAREVHGVRAYPSITDIPGSVDMVIILTPSGTVWDLLKQCARKKVKAVIVYSSGFAEAGQEGQKAQDTMREMARKGGFRILGPNCMGVYSPAYKLAPFPGLPKAAGCVAFLSQSGSLGNLFTAACASRNIFFRHVVSYGNAADVDLPELIEYMGADAGVRIICSYCEGIKDGEALVKALRGISCTKPLLMWKAGDTASGHKAALSHTGSMAGEGDIWKAIFQQHRITDVKDIEEFLDVLMAFYHLPWEAGPKVVILSGPGGPAVSAADAVERNGLELASLDERTVSKLRNILPATGTSTMNPVDVGLSASFDLRQYLDSLNIIAGDDNAEAMVVVGGGVSRDANEIYIHGLVRLRNETGKALIAIAYPGFMTEDDLLKPLYEAGIPVYPTPERALRAYARLKQYHDFCKSRRMS